MHILLIHQAFAAIDEPGGTRHHELARHLAGRGHTVTVIASPVSYLTGQAGTKRNQWVERQDGGPGVTILRAYTLPTLHRSFFTRVFSFFSFMFSSFWIGLRVRNVDLVWGTSPPIFQGITAWALARLKKVPFLFEVRDLWPSFAIAVGVLRNSLLIRLSSSLERFLYRHADRVMVNSPGFIDHVSQRGAKKIILIPNGADIEMFDPQADGGPFRHQWGLEGKFVVMYAGAHGLSNDLGVVLKAAELLRQSPVIVFALVGDGKDKPGLVTQARQMRLENLVFIPPVPKLEMSRAFAAADACLAILKPVEMYKTVYPNKVFDYMAAGKPVILAIDGVIREVVERAGCGVSVEPGSPEALAEAVFRLSQDPQLGRAMGQAGRRLVESEFSRQVLAGRLVELLEEMVPRLPG